LNLAQIIITAAPGVLGELSLEKLKAVVDYIKLSVDLTEIADDFYLHPNIIRLVKKLVELALTKPEVLQSLYLKAGMSFTLGEIKNALTLWKIMEIVRQVADQAYTYVYENPSGYIIFQAIKWIGRQGQRSCQIYPVEASFLRCG
jgi:hypothetical protein